MAEGIKNQFVGMLFVNIDESESRKKMKSIANCSVKCSQNRS